MDAFTRSLLGEGRRMTTAIIFAGMIISIAIFFSAPDSRDYRTELKNIAYQLSRIADALNKKG
jgi:hypothetical protein